MLQSKVLVVDDEENILSAFKDFFRKEHCEMMAASSGEKGLEILAHHRVNLLVTDIRLTGISGVTFFLEAKRIHPKLPVVVITGYPDVITEDAVKSYGADFFFQKPLDLEKFRAAVRRFL
jgi:DNA-binding NtrC family response regulator